MPTDPTTSPSMFRMGAPVIKNHSRCPALCKMGSSYEDACPFFLSSTTSCMRTNPSSSSMASPRVPTNSDAEKPVIAEKRGWMPITVPSKSTSMYPKSNSSRMLRYLNSLSRSISTCESKAVWPCKFSSSSRINREESAGEMCGCCMTTKYLSRGICCTPCLKIRQHPRSIPCLSATTGWPCCSWFCLGWEAWALPRAKERPSVLPNHLPFEKTFVNPMHGKKRGS